MSTKPKSRILKLLVTVAMAALIQFNVADKYREGDIVDGVHVYIIGPNLKANFLGMIEATTEAGAIKIFSLKEPSGDDPILAELGHVDAAITLGQLWELLKKQGRGQGGDLLVDGRENVSYVRDQNGMLWDVYCHFITGRGWNIEAVPPTKETEEEPEETDQALEYEWHAKDRVISG